MTAAVALLVSCVCMWVTGRGYAWSRAAVRWVQEDNADSVSLKILTDLQAQMTELVDSHESLLASHKTLRSRVGMREAREKGRSQAGNSKTPVDLPDPQSDPEGWKRAMRARLRIGIND